MIMVQSTLDMARKIGTLHLECLRFKYQKERLAFSSNSSISSILVMVCYAILSGQPDIVAIREL